MEELRGLGFTDEQVAEYMQRLESKGRENSDVSIWEGDHERALELFQRSPIEMQAGMNGAIFTGIKPSELDVVARTMGVHLTAGLLDDVLTMGGAAAHAMNQQRAAQ